MLIEQKTKQGYLVGEHGDGVSLSLPNDKNRRGRVQKGKAPTLQTSDNVGVIIDPDREVRACLTPERAKKRQNGRRFKENGEPMFMLTAQDRHGVGIREREGSRMTNERIRTLTEREYWRLMGFSDEAFDRAAKVTSKTQLYAQAGNSIVVPVLEAIFRELYTKKQPKVFKIEDWGK